MTKIPGQGNEAASGHELETWIALETWIDIKVSAAAEHRRTGRVRCASSLGVSPSLSFKFRLQDDPPEGEPARHQQIDPWLSLIITIYLFPSLIILIIPSYSFNYFSTISG